MELEHIAYVKICDAVGINLIGGKSEVCLLCVQVDIYGNGYICFAVDSFARGKSGDEIGANNLPGSFGYGD